MGDVSEILFLTHDIYLTHFQWLIKIFFKYVDRQPKGCLYWGKVKDKVFKALADSSRRALLDRLRSANGQTLAELCHGHDMTRQAVTKHLRLLEDAQLIITSKKGREKFHYLNPAPIHDIYRRWIGRF
jgi:DNA-binding transcriptional ArsR family regulator